MDPELEKWLRTIENRVYDVQQRLYNLELQVKEVQRRLGVVPKQSDSLPFLRESDIRPVKG